MKDRNAVLGILDDIRVLMLKHKVKNEQKREDIESNPAPIQMRRRQTPPSTPLYP